MEGAGVESLLMMILMLLPTPRLVPSVQSYSNSLSLHLSVAAGKMMKVISTDAGALQPRKPGQAEILDSSLVNYSSVTVCARFLTHHFSTHPEDWPTQSLISYGLDDLLASYLAMPCDQSYAGCTQQYKDIFSENQLPWISGKVFGYLLISNNHHFYPAWWPAVWNSACLTASPALGHYRININGLTVWQREEFTSNLFKEEKVR